MLRAAIVDDDVESINKLKEYLGKYSKEMNEPVNIASFEDSAQFIFDYQPIYDVVFLDVQMPKYNGMQLAEEIRKKDKSVAIIFETQYGEYALQGYKYNALDYFLKPFSYPEVKMRLDIIRNKLTEKTKSLTITTEDKMMRVLQSNEILYVEEVGRKQVFHMNDGNEYTNSKREGLAELEKKLSDYGFARCNSGFLLNLKHCTAIRQNDVYMTNLPFEISRGFKKAFLEKLFRNIDFRGEN